MFSEAYAFAERGLLSTPSPPFGLSSRPSGVVSVQCLE